MRQLIDSRRTDQRWQPPVWQVVTMEFSCLLAAVVAACLYVNTFDADFAYDDSRAIVRNPDLLPDTPWTNLLWDDFWGTPLTHSGSHKSYRPLTVATFRVNYLAGTLSPWGYHATNVALHALATGVFTHLAHQVQGSAVASLVAGLLFASHPVHTEAVAGVVGRADVLACLFLLLTLLAYWRYVAAREGQSQGDAAGRRWLAMCGVVLLTTCCMLAKEQAVSVLAVCAAYDVVVVSRTPLLDAVSFKVFYKSRYRRLREGLVCLFLCGGCLVGFRVYFMGNKPPEFAPSDNPASDSDSLLTRTLTFNYLPAANAILLLFPYTLSFDWSMDAVPLVTSVTDPRNLASLALYLCLALAARHIVRTLDAENAKLDLSRKLGSKIVSNGHSSNGTRASPQRLSSGIASTSSVAQPGRAAHANGTRACHDLARQAGLQRKSVDILVLSLSLLVFPFIPASNLFFYVGFVLAERILYIPSAGLCLLVAHGARLLWLGARATWQRRGIAACVAVLLVMFSVRTWRRNGDWLSEERLYTAGIAVNPAKAWGNLANILNDAGRAQDAETAYRNALKHRGNMADVHYNLGILLQNQGRRDEAMESYKRAINFRPKLTVAHLNLGILTAQTGDAQTAAKIYRHCADLDTAGLKDPRLHESTKVSCLYNLARLLAENTMLQEALTVYEEALERRPSHYPAQSIQNMLGELYMKMNDDKMAEHWYREALRSKPDHMPAHLTLARLFVHRGHDDEAVRWFEKARALEPNEGTVDHHHAQLHVARGRHAEAAELYREALKKNPDDFDIIFNAANVFRQINDRQMSEQLYLKATQLRPQEATAHMNLGAMLHMNGRLAEAEASYLRALQLKPADAITLDNLAKLRNLMASKGAR